MVEDRPERKHVYEGAITDGRRWDRLEVRPGDIFVCTGGKTGTTWMQAICALLIFQRPDLDFNPAEISPWFDARMLPLETCLTTLEAQRHRRFIKTHTPLDGLPYFEEATYLCVYRDPRDAHFSMLNHVENMKSDMLNDRLHMDLREGFRKWVDESFEPGQAERFALASQIHHFKSFWAFRDLPNIHLFHYADMKHDLVREMRKIAAALNIETSDKTLQELANAAQFATMKKNAQSFAPGASANSWHDTARFFNKGTSGQWRDTQTAEDIAHYRRRMEGLLPADLIRWLEEGSQARGD